MVCLYNKKMKGVVVNMKKTKQEYKRPDVKSAPGPGQQCN